MITTTTKTTSGLRLLSLDGGGMKGIFAAAILACLEEDLDISVVDHFDLVTGTSTGGIIALGLGAGLRPREIVEFYVSHGPAIFPRPRVRATRRLLRSKHRVRPLRLALEECSASGPSLTATWRSQSPPTTYATTMSTSSAHRTPRT